MLPNELEKNVYSGENSLRRFLNPANQVTPLIELPSMLNPYLQEGVRMYVKRMDMTPLNNVKSVPAYNMLQSAAETGQLADVTDLWENSSGNTVYSAAILGRAFGIPTTHAIVSDEVSPGKLDLLRFFGVNIQVNPEPLCPKYGDPKSGIYIAKVKGQQSGNFNPGQYDNEANPQAHERYTGPQIWEQVGGDLSVLCAGLGTTGTITGLGKFFKAQSPDIQVVGVVRASNNQVPGVRTENLLEEVAFPWKDYVDVVEKIGTIESYQESLKMCRLGLLMGPSSGFALAGLKQYIERQIKSGEIDRLRNQAGEVPCVFIGCDTPYPYIAEYFHFLSPEEFPQIQNSHLLKRTANPTKQFVRTSRERVIDECEISPLDAHQEIFGLEPDDVWQIIRDGNEIIMEGATILDTRIDFEYDDHHIPGAENDLYENVFGVAKKLSERSLRENQSQRLYLTCAGGGQSLHAAFAIKAGFPGVEAYSIKGGMLEWSRMDLPRIKSSTCQL